MFEAWLGNKRRGRPGPMDELAFDTTLFSLSTEMPRPSERRSDERLLALLPVARMVGEDSQTLARVRNVSAAGLMLETGASPAVGIRVRIEFNSHQQLPGEIAWIREGTCGVKFDRDIDLRELLANRPARRTGHSPRPPRLDISCSAELLIDSVLYRTRIRDISLGGLKAAVGDIECVDRKVTAMIESLRPVKGVVRWHKEGHAGIVFDRPLGFEELAEWIGKRVEMASLKAGAWSSAGRG